jgi:hypothetical protein
VTDNQGATDTDTIIVTVNALATSNPRVTDGLVALYTFDEGSGNTVNDISGVGQPLPLAITVPGNVTWMSGGGLRVNSETRIMSSGPATKIINTCRAANELTVEAWIQPDNVSQDGPARIVSLSADANNRNFTLGQGLWGGQPSDLFDFRLRTTTTGNNGTPSVSTPAGRASTALMHVVYTRGASGAVTFYLDGAPVKTATVGGDFSNWNNGYRLALANEVGADRPWLGDFHLIAIYCRALDSAEVTQNLDAGLTH